MQSSKEFPLENNGDFTTRIQFTTASSGERFVQFCQPHRSDDDEVIILTAAQFHEAIRLSIGHLFPITAVDETMLARHIADHMLAAVRENVQVLLKVAAGNYEGKDLYIAALVRTCVAIAILTLRSIEDHPPVQGEQS